MFLPNFLLPLKLYFSNKFIENFKILDSIQDLVILPFEFRVSKWCPAVI